MAECNHGPREQRPITPLRYLLTQRGVPYLLSQVEERLQRIGDHIRAYRTEMKETERCECEVCERLQHESLRILEHIKNIVSGLTPVVPKDTD